jgi:hypothetical protein
VKAATYWQLASHTALALSAFLLAYLLLRYTPAQHYGSFTFVLVLQAFGMALCNALIASPLLILMNGQQQSTSQGSPTKGFLILGVAIASAVALLQGVYLWFSLADFWISVTLAIAGWLQLIRWYGRCEWQNRDVKVLLASDLRFSVFLVVGAALLWWFHRLSLQNIGALLVFVSMVALGPFLVGFYTSFQQKADWQFVTQGYQKQGKPALFGVLTVEATANFHSYLVVLGSGSAAFAPLAAAMLFFRPLAVVLNSLLQSERPKMAQAFSAGHLGQMLQYTASIRATAIASVGVNVLVLALIYFVWPDWLWPEPATRSEFAVALLLWGFVSFFRALRSSVTALMQAADQFEPLARATYLSAAWTIPAVAVCWWQGGAIASLFGVLSGEILLGLLLWRARRSLMLKSLTDIEFSHKERKKL